MTKENKADELEIDPTLELEPTIESELEPELDEDGNPIKEEVEAWMQTGDEVEPEPELEPVAGEDGVIPKKPTVKQKLRRKLEESETELEKLRKENAKLKGGSQQLSGDVKRPNRDDFEEDSDYDDAYEVYLDAKADARDNTRTNQVAQEQVIVERKKAVNAHFDRAETLINDRGIKAEAYEEADKIVRDSFSSVLGKDNGPAAVDQIIDILGEGSEKTMWYLGRNKAALAQATELLKKDPQGYRLIAFLGGKQKEFEGAKSKTSQARKPAASITGTGTPAKEGAWKKKYDAAHAANKGQDAFNIKSDAKAAGVDTKDW